MTADSVLQRLARIAELLPEGASVMLPGDQLRDALRCSEAPPQAQAAMQDPRPVETDDMLNVGYRRGARVQRCVERNGDYEIAWFDHSGEPRG